MSSDPMMWPPAAAGSAIAMVRARLSEQQAEIAAMREQLRTAAEQRQTWETTIAAVTSQSSDARVIAALVAERRLELLEIEQAKLKERLRAVERGARATADELGGLIGNWREAQGQIPYLARTGGDSLERLRRQLRRLVGDDLVEVPS